MIYHCMECKGLFEENQGMYFKNKLPENVSPINSPSSGYCSPTCAREGFKKFGLEPSEIEDILNGGVVK